jgi:DNA-binding MarR family transcriptional regulator
VLPEVLQFMRLLWALDHDLQRTSKRMLRAFGVTGPQRLALRLIGQFAGISPGELAELLHVHPSTLTGVLARLLDQGLIIRDTSPQDARRSVLRLSRSGMRLDAVREGTVEAAVTGVLSRTPADHRQCVTRILRQLSAALGSAVDELRVEGTNPGRSRKRLPGMHGPGSGHRGAGASK